MRVAYALALLWAVGCHWDWSDEPTGTYEPLDLAAPDLAPRRDLGPWCSASGPAPTCGGVSCAPGCTCLVDFSYDDGMGATPYGRCDCQYRVDPAHAPTNYQLICCGGLTCLSTKNYPQSCSPQNDCHPGP